MDAGGAEQLARVLAGQFQCSRAAFLACAGHNHLHHAGFTGALQHLVPVAIEGVVGQVATNIDQVHSICACWERIV